jgi:hypothetical protein
MFDDIFNKKTIDSARQLWIKQMMVVVENMLKNYVFEVNDSETRNSLFSEIDNYLKMNVKGYTLGINSPTKKHIKITIMFADEEPYIEVTFTI